MVQRVDTIEAKVDRMEKKEKPDFDPEVSIIVANFPTKENEDIKEEMSAMVRRGLQIPEGTCPVVRAVRLPLRRQQNGRPQNPTRPPLVKVEFRTLDEKIKVLKAKMNIHNSEWPNLYIRSARPHMERLMDINFKTLLDMMPNGSEMKITSSGRIVRKDD